MPFLLLSLVWRRTSYLYYMVIVMPAIYVAVVRVLSRLSPGLRAAWIVLLIAAAVVMYPLTPLP